MENFIPIVDIDPSAQNTFLGTVFHECVDALYLGKDWKETFNAWMAKPEVIAIHTKRDDQSGSISHLKELITRYIDHYQAPNDRDFEVLATERSAEMPLSDRITYIGKIDKEVKLRESGFRAVVDHKTSSSLKTWVEPGVEMRDQYTGYVALSQAAGIDVDTVVVDGVSTAKKALDDGLGLFIRWTVKRNTDKVNEWRNRMTYRANRFIADIESGLFDADMDKECTAFNRKCPFYEFCCSSGQVAGNILKNKFKINPTPWGGFKVIYE